MNLLCIQLKVSLHPILLSKSIDVESGSVMNPQQKGKQGRDGGWSFTRSRRGGHDRGRMIWLSGSVWRRRWISSGPIEQENENVLQAGSISGTISFIAIRM